MKVFAGVLLVILLADRVGFLAWVIGTIIGRCGVGRGCYFADNGYTLNLVFWKFPFRFSAFAESVAFTVGRTVILPSPAIPEKHVLEHESEHVWQYRFGLIWFFLCYFWLLKRFGYWNHPMEIAAARHAGEAWPPAAIPAGIK